MKCDICPWETLYLSFLKLKQTHHLKNIPFDFVGWLMKESIIYRLNICVLSKFICWRLNSYSEGIQRWGVWEITRSGWSHEHGPLHDGTQFCSVQLLSRVPLFATPWTTACQASLSITNSRSLPKLMSTESVMPSNHLILCRPLLLLPSVFPSIRVFSNVSALHIRWPKDWSFTLSTVLPMNTQDWSPLGWTGWISLLSKGLLRVFSNTTVQKPQGTKRST